MLYVTGFSDGLFRDKPVLWDGEAFLEKPFSLASIGEAVSLLYYGHISAAASYGGGSALRN